MLLRRMWEWRLYVALYYVGVEAVCYFVECGSGGCTLHCTIYEWRLYVTS